MSWSMSGRLFPLNMFAMVVMEGTLNPPLSSSTTNDHMLSGCPTNDEEYSLLVTDSLGILTHCREPS